MANSYLAVRVHYVFSTKERRRLITPELKTRLYPFIGGIARENKMKLIAIGGIADHVHLLLAMAPMLSVAKTIQMIKGGSSAWVRDTFPQHWRFGWQEGYGAFSVSASQMAATIDYIENQEEHHKNRTFEKEYIALLKKHGVEYDERFLWG
jgi:putative transposase